MAQVSRDTAKKRLEAQRRAEALLRDLVGDEVYRRSLACGYLETRSPNFPGRVYRIPWKGGFVTVVEGGRPIEMLCVAPCASLPPADALVTHKLLIEADEERYLAADNHFPNGVGDGSPAQFLAYLARFEA